jgi:hypothetical protein
MISQRSKTVAVLFGASQYPDYPALDASPAFAKSKTDFRSYLTSRLGMKADTDILDLFDKDLQPGQVITRMREFLDGHCSGPNAATDVIFYYCGHGAYLREKEYFLALQCTSKKSKEPTVFKISYLVDIVSEVTNSQRNLVILDACYSGGALIEFGHLDGDDDAAQLLDSQISSALEDHEASQGVSGTVLFCAAGSKKWAKTPLEAEYTMFSGAMLKALQNGDEASGPYLSVRRVGELVKKEIKTAFGNQGVQPQIHVPVQGQADLLNTLFFPNPAFNPMAFATRLSRVEEGLNEIRGAIASSAREMQTLVDRNLSQMTKLLEDVPSVQTTGRNTSEAAIESDGVFSNLFFSGRALTIGVMFLLDIVTYAIVLGAAISFLDEFYNRSPSASVASAGSSEFTIQLIFLLAVHGIVAIVNFVLVIQAARSANARGLLGAILPRGVSYVAIAWNSLAATVGLVFLLTIPNATAARYAIQASRLLPIQSLFYPVGPSSSGSPALPAGPSPR